ncbi:MAG TPA: M28 family peptidase [Terriglobales bacterium]|nr:M28 family peptidase [Terriglobales bacterium]
MKTRALTVVFAVFCVAAFVPTAAAQVSFLQVKEEVVKQRLEKAKGKNPERKAALVLLFQEAGCSESLSEQVVKGSKIPNVVCTLKGETDSVIVVGAHFDRSDEGDGIVDNWSGASLLPTLFESLKQAKRKHTYIFVGFTDEEKGLVGSQYYVKLLKKEDIAKIHAMVNLDTLGLGDTEVWVSRADNKLVTAIATIASSMSLPVTGMNVDDVGTTDSESFREKKIPAITLHSLTQDTMQYIHSPKDNLKAIKAKEYYQSYRLIAAYLAFLDQVLTADLPTEKIDTQSKEKK